MDEKPKPKSITIEQVGDSFRVDLRVSLKSKYQVIGKAIKAALGDELNFRLLDIYYPVGMEIDEASREKLHTILNGQYDVWPAGIEYSQALEPADSAEPATPDGPMGLTWVDDDAFVTITAPLPSQYNAIGQALKDALGKKQHFSTLEIHHPRGMDIMSGSKNKFRHILERKYDVNPLNIAYKATLPFQGVK